MDEIGTHEQQTDAAIGQTLRGGLYLAIAVMLIGALASTISGRAGRTVLPLDKVVSGVTSGNPAAVLDLGILLLFATPLAGVLVALVQFVREQDPVFAGLTALLLGILVAGFAVALR